MTEITWARLQDGAVAELRAFDSALVPGRDLPALWTDDVTLVDGIEVGWIKGTDGGWSAPAAAAISEGEVSAERDRRFRLGAPVTTSTGKEFRADIDETSRINLTALAFASNQPDAGPFAFRDHSNTTQHLTGPEMLETATQAMARVSAVYEASWTLKAASPIPADYADDTHWPTPA